MKLIPEETRIQQINALPNVEFVRWVDGYRATKSKAVCRCVVDGFEWVAQLDSLLNQGKGCPQCSRKRRWTAEERIEQINELPNITFVRWVGDYKGNKSKAVCQCGLDGFKWQATVDSLLNQGSGCPQCSGKRRRTAEERIAQINAKPNIEFVRWANGYHGAYSKAVCRCGIDGLEWASTVNSLINTGHGCPQCAGMRRWTAEERIAHINAKPNIEFVRWDGTYKTKTSKAVCRCQVDGHEWSARIDNLINNGSGCPKCAKTGYDQTKAGTLYILRSDCGGMMKVGISNDYRARHVTLKRETPFNWACIELLHGGGDTIAEFEKELHSWTKRVEFKEPFEGHTEWRKWDDRLPMWVKRHRDRLERYNKAP